VTADNCWTLGSESEVGAVGTEAPLPPAGATSWLTQPDGARPDTSGTASSTLASRSTPNHLSVAAGVLAYITANHLDHLLTCSAVSLGSGHDRWRSQFSNEYGSSGLSPAGPAQCHVTASGTATGAPAGRRRADSILFHSGSRCETAGEVASLCSSDQRGAVRRGYAAERGDGRPDKPAERELRLLGRGRLQSTHWSDGRRIRTGTWT